MLRGFPDLHFPSPPQKELGSNASSQTHQVHFSSFRLNSRSSPKVNRPLNISDSAANICEALLGFSVPAPGYLPELALPNSLRMILPPARPALQWLTGSSQV